MIKYTFFIGILKRTDNIVMEKDEFVKGDIVAYGKNGVCSVEEIKPLSFSEGMKECMYYILKPEANPESKIFVPAENEGLVSKMRDLMTKEEIDSLILDTKDREIKWDTNRRYRNENFHEILSRGVHSDMLLMIRCIIRKKHELMEIGKKLPTTDNNTLKSAEKLIQEEFSYVLKIDNTEVEGYIKDTLNISEAV